MSVNDLSATELYLNVFKDKFKIKSACWWCTYDFETLPVCAPSSYDDRSKTFKVFGVFCSFQCAKSYVVADNKSYVDASLITLLNKRLTGKMSRINCAPPRIALQRFGGDFTIEEFREKSQIVGMTYIVNKQNILYNKWTVVKSENRKGAQTELGVFGECIKDNPLENTETISLKSPQRDESKKRQVPSKMKVSTRQDHVISNEHMDNGCSQQDQYNTMKTQPVLINENMIRKKNPNHYKKDKTETTKVSLENWMNLTISS